MHTPSVVEEIFLAAVEKATPDERAAYLDKACRGDAELRRRVERLLAAYPKAGSFLEEAVAAPPATGEYTPHPDDGHPPLQQTTDHEPTIEAGRIIASRYTLVEQIGEGGMGEVWVARQTEPVKRRVALKLIKAGMDTKAVLQRFEAERQALAMMDHPNIARVLDGGVTAERRPFFAMELVNGLPLTKFCDDAGLTPNQRLELFVPICQAVQHAHQKGIIHRDLKPGNILVTLIDGKPVPKVIDFGVAKAIGTKLTDESLATQFGAVVGTLEYMAPEQAGFSGIDIDTRADVYSLGVILYELLTGLRPIDSQRLKKAALTEMIRIIQQEEPSKPSTRLSTDESLPSLAAARHIEPKKLMAMLRGELDWVVMKCLEKQRERRYETASGLARDIQRYLADETVEARPPSAGYRLKKFIRRHPLQLALAATIALLLLGAAAVAWWQSEQAGARRETDLRRQLEDEKRTAADNARLARNAEAVAALLGQGEQALRAREAAKAEVALDAARQRSAEGGTENEAAWLGRLTADLALMHDLDDIDQFRWTWSANRFPDPAIVAARTRDALARFGADPDTASVDESAARINASVIREQIVTALDRRLQREKADAVRDVLHKVDGDPYRDAVRDAVLARDSATFVKLAEQDLALEQPPGFVVVLAESEAIPAARRWKLLQSAVMRRSGDVDLLMALGTISDSYSANRQDGAIERMRWFQAAIAADPDNAAALNDLGRALDERGQADAARACFRKAIELDPTLAFGHYNLAHQFWKDGRLDEAIEGFRKAIELDPDDAFFHYDLGRILEAKGLWHEAIESYKRAIAFDPHHVQAYNDLATSLHQTGQTDEAIVLFRQMIELEPDNPQPRYNLGLSLQAAGQLDEAIASFRKTIELDPEIANAHGALGSVLGAQGQLDEAIASLRKAIELDPKNAPGHLGLGAILCDFKKDYDGAVVCFRTAIELEPQSADAYMNLGNALSGKGELDEAGGCYRRAIELNPRHATARYGLACCLTKTAAGEGDATKRARLRKQALDALRETLDLFTQQLEAETPTDRAAVQSVLRQLQQDTDLSHIRDAAALAEIPPDEQRAFTQLWEDVAALRKKAETPTPAAARGDTPDSVLSFLEETVIRQKVQLGSEHPETIRSMVNLALAYHRAEKLDLAIQLFEEALELATAQFGADHVDTMAVRQSLAVVNSLAKQYVKSIPLFEEILRFREATLGRDHVDTLLGMANLGVNLRDAGRLAEAIPLLEEARRAVKQYPQLGWVTDALFHAYLQIDDHESAAGYWAALIPTLRTELGEDHPTTLVAMNNRGYSLARSRQFTEAEAVLNETIEREVRTLGEGHMLLLQTRTNLGELYQLRGQHAPAEALLRRCLAEREEKDPNSFRLASTQSLLGRVLAEEGKFAEAESLLLAGYQGLKDSAGATPFWGKYYLPDTLQWLSELYEDWGRPDEAAKWRAEQEAVK